ncbi:MAG: SOS response-associated peptidase [Fibrella sp.]|nr:SOS response-associated peptidase [Armatimonadota bacterium]
MCGRFTLHHDADAIVERFDVHETVVSVAPRYNIAPQQTVPVIVAPQSERILDSFRWGLVPGWAKDAAIGQKMINARSETLAEKPSFRTALVRRRCLIPADGFYEWERHADGSRHPVHFRLNGGEPFAFAGLWEEWQDPQGENALRTCTIVTTSANETVGRVHDRMPVILARDAEEIWLDMSVRDTDLLRSFFVSYPDREMEAFSVSRRVNSPTNEGPELLATDR